MARVDITFPDVELDERPTVPNWLARHIIIAAAAIRLRRNQDTHLEHALSGSG
jgi:hypothetical protein